MDRHSPWRARTQVFQEVEDTGIFRHVVGHLTSLTDQAVFLQEDGTIVAFDYDSEGSGSSGINRFASSIEPRKVFVQAHLTIWGSSSVPRDFSLGYVRLLRVFWAAL